MKHDETCPYIELVGRQRELLNLALKYLYKAKADGMETAIPVENVIRAIENLLKESAGLK